MEFLAPTALTQAPLVLASMGGLGVGMPHQEIWQI